MREYILSGQGVSDLGSLLESGVALPEMIQNMSHACTAAAVSLFLPQFLSWWTHLSLPMRSW